MKTIANLLRGKASIQHSYRRTYGNANMPKRKDLRRLKKINIYNKEISGQSNPNSWFTPKRIKAMANHIQAKKNTHVGTNPIDPQVQKDLLKVMSNLSDFQYYNFRNRQQQLIQFEDFVNSSNTEQAIKQMPSKLRKQVLASESNPTPQIAETLLKYTQQLQIYLPQDERYRYNLMLKLQHPPKAKMDSDQN